MKNFIIQKWVEPYKLLETIKQYYQYKDFTFNGQNKQEQKEKFLNSFNESNYYIGLYMKNVNKFYLFMRKNNFNIEQKLIDIFELSTKDYYLSNNVDEMFDMIDLGKAEAGLLVVS